VRGVCLCGGGGGGGGGELPPRISHTGISSVVFSSVSSVGVTDGWPCIFIGLFLTSCCFLSQAGGGVRGGVLEWEIVALS